MLELLLKNHLDGILEVPSFFEHQEDLPDEYIMIEKTGSSDRNKLKTATIAFQSYSISLYSAAVLNEKVKAAVERAIELERVSAVHLNSDYNFTDTETKRHRYQAVYDIYYY